MTTKQKTIIVTGATQAIGAAAPSLFVDRGYNVVGDSRKIGRKNELPRSDNLALVDGDIGLASTAQMIVDTALKRFASVYALINNIGTVFAKPFTERTPENFRTLSSTNLRRDDHQRSIDAVPEPRDGYALQGIRVNVLAQGVADSPLHKNKLKEFLRTLSPLGQTAPAKDIAEAAAIVPNLDQGTFDRLAQDAEQNCPISRVLEAETTLNARLV